jgi:hypothetical protein
MAIWWKDFPTAGSSMPPFNVSVVAALSNRALRYSF